MNAIPHVPPDTAPERPAVGALRQLLAAGMPLFPNDDIARSSPGNGAPYPVAAADLLAVFAGDSRRLTLLGALLATIRAMPAGIRIHATLLGGSMLDQRVARPRDLDAVLFYAVDEEAGSAAIAAALAATVAGAKAADLDLRFVPVDAGAPILVRAVGYFTSLYASAREPGARRRGSLLLAGENT